MTPPSEAFYVRFRGRVTGPLSREALVALLRSGKISSLHEVSSDGAAWRRYADPGELVGERDLRTVSSRSPVEPAPTSPVAPQASAHADPAEAIRAVGAATDHPVESSADARCPRCKKENPPDVRFCQHCGANLESLFRNCPKCQRELRIDIQHCGGCGVRVATYRLGQASELLKQATAHLKSGSLLAARDAVMRGLATGELHADFQNLDDRTIERLAAEKADQLMKEAQRLLDMRQWSNAQAIAAQGLKTGHFANKFRVLLDEATERMASDKLARLLRDAREHLDAKRWSDALDAAKQGLATGKQSEAFESVANRAKTMLDRCKALREHSMSCRQRNDLDATRTALRSLREICAETAEVDRAIDQLDDEHRRQMLVSAIDLLHAGRYEKARRHAQAALERFGRGGLSGELSRVEGEAEAAMRRQGRRISAAIVAAALLLALLVAVSMYLVNESHRRLEVERLSGEITRNIEDIDAKLRVADVLMANPALGEAASAIDADIRAIEAGVQQLSRLDDSAPDIYSVRRQHRAAVNALQARAAQITAQEQLIQRRAVQNAARARIAILECDNALASLKELNGQPLGAQSLKSATRILGAYERSLNAAEVAVMQLAGEDSEGLGTRVKEHKAAYAAAVRVRDLIAAQLR